MSPSWCLRRSAFEIASDIGTLRSITLKTLPAMKWTLVSSTQRNKHLRFLLSSTYLKNDSANATHRAVHSNFPLLATALIEAPEDTVTNTTQDSTTLIKLSDSGQTIATDDIDVRNHSVIDTDGKTLGKVDDLLIDSQHHKVRMLRVEHGGFLGIGATKTFIPIDAITKITADDVYISHSVDHVATAPAYNPKLVDDQSYYGSLYGHYGYTPFWVPGYMYPAYLSSWSSGMAFGATDGLR